jgi:hypothetical protein
MKILDFFLFCGPFLPSWIRIRIRNLNPDPDPTTQINADPDTDPDPKPCLVSCRVSDPDWIRVQLGQRIWIQAGILLPGKELMKKFHV